MFFVAYLLTGAVAGVLAGLLGVGGGLIIVPALVYLFSQQHISPEVLTHMAVGTSLATIVITSISSVRAHHLQKAVQWSVFKTLAIGIVVGALLGAALVDRIQGPILQNLIGIFAILVALQMGLGLKPRSQKALPGQRGLVASGTAIGSVSAIFGIGGGSLTVPMLTYYSVPMQQAVGTSAACGLPIAVAGAIGFMITGWGETALPSWSTGYVYWPAFAGIVCSSVFFAMIGAKIAHRLPADSLKKVFALLLFIIGARFLLS